MNKLIIAFLGIFLITQNICAGDTEIALFDEAQDIFLSFENEELELIRSLNQNVYRAWIKIPDADSLYRKLSRIAFLERLKRTDEREYWSNPYIWSDGLENTDHLHKLCKKNTECLEIIKRYQRLKKEKLNYLKETKVYQKRNELQKNNCEAFTDIENCLHERLMELQIRMDTIRKKE